MAYFAAKLINDDDNDDVNLGSAMYALSLFKGDERSGGGNSHRYQPR